MSFSNNLNRNGCGSSSIWGLVKVYNVTYYKASQRIKNFIGGTSLLISLPCFFFQPFQMLFWRSSKTCPPGPGATCLRAENTVATSAWRPSSAASLNSNARTKGSTTFGLKVCLGFCPLQQRREEGELWFELMITYCS